MNDLRELLSKRKLPTNGKKEELIARLEASDRDADLAEPAPVADPTAHLPSAEEYEINWDEDDTAATGAKSAKSALAKPEVTKVAATSSSEGAVTTATVGTEQSKTEEQASKDGKKPFTFKRLAEQFTDLPSTKKPDNKKAKSEKPKEAPAMAVVEVKADEAPAEPEAEVKQAAPEPTFAAGLAPTPLEAELEKRKARAARFGAEQTDPKAAESLKKLERAARFGGGGTTGDAESTVGVKGLDQALPERKGKRAGEHGSSGGRGGVQKRTRFGGDRGQRRHGGGGDRRNGGAGAGNQQKKTGGAPAVNSVLDDPAEREKAEKRKNRFGNAA